MIHAVTNTDVTDYDSLIEALRSAKSARGLSDGSVDELGGLTRGHTEKVLGPSRTKNLSPMMLETLLGVLAVKLVLVDDPAAAARMEKRWDRRDEKRVRTDAHRVSMRMVERAKPAVFRQLSEKAAVARKSKISPKMRSKIARKAARARWHPQKRRERKSPPLAPV